MMGQPPTARLPQSSAVDPAGDVVEDPAPTVHGDAGPMDMAEELGELMTLGDGFEGVQEELDSLQLPLRPDARAEAADLARVLFALGASPVEAKAVLTEVYSPPRVTAHAARFPRFGVLPGGAFDLRPGPDGRSWDFEDPNDRAECERRIDRAKPFLLIGCPHALIGPSST